MVYISIMLKNVLLYKNSIQTFLLGSTTSTVSPYGHAYG